MTGSWHCNLTIRFVHVCALWTCHCFVACLLCETHFYHTQIVVLRNFIRCYYYGISICFSILIRVPHPPIHVPQPGCSTHPLRMVVFLWFRFPFVMHLQGEVTTCHRFGASPFLNRQIWNAPPLFSQPASALHIVAHHERYIPSNKLQVVFPAWLQNVAPVLVPVQDGGATMLARNGRH